MPPLELCTKLLVSKTWTSSIKFSSKILTRKSPIAQISFTGLHIQVLNIPCRVCVSGLWSAHHSNWRKRFSWVVSLSKTRSMPTREIRQDSVKLDTHHNTSWNENSRWYLKWFFPHCCLHITSKCHVNIWVHNRTFLVKAQGKWDVWKVHMLGCQFTFTGTIESVY